MQAQTTRDGRITRKDAGRESVKDAGKDGRIRRKDAVKDG
jgi:hypothetical protein